MMNGRQGRICLMILVGLVLGASLWALPAGAEEFTATALVDRTRITPEEGIILQVVVTGGEARVDTSALKDFELLSQGSSSQRSWVNGDSEHKVIYQFRLAPLGTGTLVIPPLTVSRDGEARYTQAITIQAAEAEQGPGQARPLFAKALVSRTELVVGEQFLYTFEFHTALRIVGGKLDRPSFTGFSVKELKERSRRTEVVNGVEYAVTGIHYLLTPAGAGTHEIEPAQLSAQVLMPRRGSDSFDSLFNDSFFNQGQTRSLRITSNPVNLRVSPLPPLSGDLPFSGLVGEFNLTAQVDKTQLTAGESVTLSLTLEGRGNIMDAQIPALALDQDSFKVYEDSPVEEIGVDAKGLAGKKVFKRALVPLKAGTLQIPPVKLSYFNTLDRQYQTLVTDLFLLEVAPSQEILTAPEARPMAGDNGSEKQAVEVVNQDILDIRQNLTALESKGPWSPGAFAALAALPLLALGLVRTWAGRRGRHRNSLSRQLRERAKAHVKAAAQHAGTGNASDEVARHLREGLTAVLCGRGGARGELFTQEEARTIMEESQASPDETQAVLTMLADLDNARYGGGALDRERETEFLTLLKHLIKTSLVVLVCLAGIWGSPQDSSAAEASDPHTGRRFIQAVDAYRAG